MTKTRNKTLLETILGFLESDIEDTRVRDAVAAYAEKRAGKPITKTDAEQLSKQLGGLPMRIHKIAGMTSMEWATGASPNPWSSTTSILLAYESQNGNKWPTVDELKQKLAVAWYDALDKRNEARRDAIANHRLESHGPVPWTSWVSRAALAVFKIQEAQRELEELIDYDKPLYEIRFDVEKLVKGEK